MMDNQNCYNHTCDNLQNNFSAYVGSKALSLNVNIQSEIYAESFTPPGLSPAIIGAKAPINSWPNSQQTQRLVSSSVLLTPPLQTPSFVQENFNNYNTNYQVQHHQQQQQILAQQKFLAAITQQRLALNSSSNKFQKDEIAKSLQSFANVAANRDSPTSVDMVMQDFACNGYACEDRCAQYQNANQSWVNKNELHNRNMHNYNTQYTGHTNGSLYVPQMNTYDPQYINNWKMMQSQQQQYGNICDNRTTLNLPDTNIKRTQKRLKNDKYSAKYCVFCDNNNEPEAVVKSHAVRDTFGRVLCPKLRTYICPICKASGDKAHTIKYCPQKPIITMEDALNAELLGKKL